MNRTPEQTAAIETPSRYLCVDAGAGSGKTRVLIERTVHLLESRQAKLDQIVAITFTDKAAAEMRARLRAAFHQKAPMDNPERMSFWRDLERRAETARISTIHSFCAVLLRENSLRIGIDPDFAVLAEAESTLLRSEIVTDTLHALLDKGDEPATRAAAALGTRNLIAELRRMLGKRAVMDRLDPVYWADDAEALCAHWETSARDAHGLYLLGVRGSRPLRILRESLRTFEGQCKKSTDGRDTMRAEMMALLERIADESDPAQLQLHFDTLAGLKVGATRKTNWDPEEAHEQIKVVQERLRELAAECTAPEFVPETELAAARVTGPVAATFRRIAEAFDAAKASRTARDFDDLIAEALRMLRERPEVRARVAQGIKHLLVDEFQDTDSVQLDIARLLANEAGGPDLFIVGDAKQSIYDFRGAEVEVFQGEQGAAAHRIQLDRNFRTVPDVLNFVNAFFDEQGLLEAVERDYRPLEAHRGAWRDCRIEFLIPEPDPAPSAELYRRREAELIAWRVDTLRGSALIHDKDRDGERTADYGDMAILLRSMSDIHLYEEGLRKRGIPYQVVSGAGFYERQEVRDLRNLLRVLVDPWDEPALLGFLRSPIAGLSDETLLRMAWSGQHGGSVIRFFRECGTLDGLAEGQAERLDAARALIAGLRAETERPLPAFLRTVLDRTVIEGIYLSQFMGPQKAGNIRKVVDLAEQCTQGGARDLDAFVRYIEEIALHPEMREGDAAMLAEESGAVTLMTIHKAKGLEFPLVFVPDCSRGLQSRSAGSVRLHRRLGLAVKAMLPNGEAADPGIAAIMKRDRKAMERAEHARVLYVAMTRARDALILSGSPDPKSESWMNEFDAAYGVCSSAHGYEFGGDAWTARVYRKPETETAATPPVDSVSLAGFDCKSSLARVRPIEPESRARGTVAATSLLDTMGLGSEDSPSPAAVNTGIDAAQRGTLVHSLFEQWKGVGDPGPIIESILRRDCPALHLREVLTRDLISVAERFLASPLAGRLRDAACEIPFLLRIGGVLASGTIDALLADGTIVDYKTGRRHAGTEARYEAQLCLYAAAIQTLRKQVPPAACLYYADTGEVHPVDISTQRVDAVLTQAAEALETSCG
ncbi:MAG: ATP-dependent helicase/nuclease subunit [Candidatus Hydrogenedentes bacterium]|nr:ATP-dependent helicase/nuclease subunit [Candidatus Hydrogenedentota bacterium]